MAENNQMIERPKLNFFQRIKKNSLIKKINLENYNAAPEYLKQDEDVILALVASSPKTMFQFPMQKRLDLLKTNPDFFQSLSQEQKFEIVRSAPTEYMAKLSESDALTLVNSNSDDKSLIHYLPEALQVSLLTESKPYIKISDNFGKPRSSNENTYPNSYSDSLTCFSEDAIEKAVILLLDKVKHLENPRLLTLQELKKSVPLLSNMQISELSEELQLKLALLDNDFVARMSEDAAKKFVGKNPLLFNLLDIKVKLALVKENPELFSVIDFKTKSNLLDMDSDLRKSIPGAQKLIYSNKIYESFGISDLSILKRHIINYKDSINTAKLTDYLRGRIPDIEELAKFEPDILSVWGLNDFQTYRKIDHITNIYKSHTRNPEVQAALDTLGTNLHYMNNSSLERVKITRNLPKIFLNDTVMEKVSPSLLIDFIHNPQNMDTLKEIISQAYGEQAKQILDSRPNITLEQIPNLYIFDPVVFEKFGKGTVNNMLSYSSPAPSILTDLVRYPAKMQKFEEFSRLFGDSQSDTLGFNNKLIAFQNFESALNGLNLNSLTEKQKSNLLLAYNDMFMTFHTNETSLISFNTPAELDTYADRRNAYYDDLISKTTSLTVMKSAISKRFFGMQYNGSIDSLYSQSNLSLDSMTYYYNLENFITDERTINSGNFSQDELDMLQLAIIIQKVNDPNILKQIYEKLSERDDILRPQDFLSIKNKIPQQYSQELVDSLLTIDSAKARAESGENGIQYSKTDDGIEIINLNGADFRIMLHTPGMNNSGLEIPYNTDSSEVWKNFENGCSTISSCIIEPEMLKSCATNGGINFGFYNVPANQIIGMSHHDAHVSHSPKSVNPYFEYTSVLFNYPDELMRKTAAQITNQESKDIMHEYNEVAMHRRYIDSKNQQTYGQRVMPDYIVVYGPVNETHKKMAKEFAKPDGTPIPIVSIDVKAYGDRTFMRGYRKEDHSVTRDDGNIIQEVKNIIENNKDMEL